jgi:hypothetical protein
LKALAVLVLRYTNRSKREWKVPGNIRIGGTEVPIGLAAITILLFLTALANLFSKPDATVAGIIFSAVFFGIFTASEKLTHKRSRGSADHTEQFRVYSSNGVSREALQVRSDNILVGIRDPRNLHYLRRVLATTDTSKQDIVVMTARVYHREPSFSGSTAVDTDQIFEQYERELFTAVVGVAEKEGKTVSLLLAAGTDVFDTIMLTAQALGSARIVCGLSNKLSSDEQAKLTGDAWERLADSKPPISLEIATPSGESKMYYLGAHMPRLRPEDLDLLHRIWLEVTEDPRYANIHHYDVVSLALKDLEGKLESGSRQDVIRALTGDHQSNS